MSISFICTKAIRLKLLVSRGAAGDPQTPQQEPDKRASICTAVPSSVRLLHLGWLAQTCMCTAFW